MKEKYPGISQHEAYPKFLDDAASIDPKEVKWILAEAGSVADVTGAIL
jgi:hypothetical protein